MPPRRAASRSQPPALRRPRIERACSFCRSAKQRCESIEYGTTDRPCRRCVLQGIVCNLPRTTRSQSRSQSPSAGPSLQTPGPVRHATALQPAGGATRELTPGSGNNVQHPLPQFESAPIPMTPLSTEEQQGSTANFPSPAQNSLQTSNLHPLAQSMDVYQQGFPNVAQGSFNLGPGYYQYYEQPGSYMANYPAQNAGDGEPDFGYVTEAPSQEPQPGNAGASENEHVPSFFRPGES